jgi:hypothetical protein
MREKAQSEVLWRENDRRIDDRIRISETVNLRHESYKEAKIIIKEMTNRMKSAKKRKAVPPWSAPLELWLLVLFPRRLTSPSGKHGIGYLKEFEFGSHVWYLLTWIVAAVLRRQWAPTMWNWSFACSLSKLNGKIGCQGIRFIHLLDPLGKQFFRCIFARVQRREWPQYAHGFRHHRRRECAIEIQHIISWKCRKLQLNNAMVLFDVRNAFPSPSFPSINRTCKNSEHEYVPPLLDQRHRRTTSVYRACDGYLYTRAGRGGLQGDGIGPDVFSDTFHTPIDAHIVHTHQAAYNDYLMSYCPITRQPINLSITSFADDFIRRVLFYDHDDFMQRLLFIDASLDQHLGSIFVEQNREKQEMLIKCSGVRAQTYERRLYQQLLENAHVSAKYLGSMMQVNGTNGQEIQRRIDAMNVAWHTMGRFWTSNAPINIKRMNFIAHIYSVALTGLEALVLSIEQTTALDRRILHYARRMLGTRACKIECDENEVKTYKAISTEAVWRTLQIVPSSIELRVRRLKLWQSVAENPSEFSQFLAAMFCPLSCEQFPGAPEIPEHPWLTQFCQDLAAISEFDDYNWISEFIENPLTVISDFSEDFQRIDTTILRARYLRVAVPPPGMELIMEDLGDFDDTREFKCQILCINGENCNKRFRTQRALITHQRFSSEHGVRHPFLKYVQSNQCPFCSSVFRTIATARQHVKFSFVRGYCAVDKSVTSRTVLNVDQPYSCPDCEIMLNDLVEYNIHIRMHVEPPALSLTLDPGESYGFLDRREESGRRSSGIVASNGEEGQRSVPDRPGGLGGHLLRRTRGVQPESVLARRSLFLGVNPHQGRRRRRHENACGRLGRGGAGRGNAVQFGHEGQEEPRQGPTIGLPLCGGTQGNMHEYANHGPHKRSQLHRHQEPHGFPRRAEEAQGTAEAVSLQAQLRRPGTVDRHGGSSPLPAHLGTPLGHLGAALRSHHPRGLAASVEGGEAHRHACKSDPHQEEKRLEIRRAEQNIKAGTNSAIHVVADLGLKKSDRGLHQHCTSVILGEKRELRIGEHHVHCTSVILGEEREPIIEEEGMGEQRQGIPCRGYPKSIEELSIDDSFFPSFSDSVDSVGKAQGVSSNSSSVPPPSPNTVHDESFFRRCYNRIKPMEWRKPM